MEYKASSDLTRQIDQFKKKMMIISIFRIAIVFIFAIIFYPHYKSVDIGAIVIILVVFVGVILISYSQIVTSSSILNCTVQEILINEQNIQAKTAGFKIFFIEKKANYQLFKTDALKIRETDFPLNKLFGTKFSSIKLVDEEKECYILPDFFDKELIEKFN